MAVAGAEDNTVSSMTSVNKAGMATLGQRLASWGTSLGEPDSCLKRYRVVQLRLAALVASFRVRFTVRWQVSALWKY